MTMLHQLTKLITNRDSIGMDDRCSIPGRGMDFSIRRRV